jgi:hypothetical protein
MALEKELETYKNKLPELLAEEGKFVLIKGDEVAGTYAAYEDALKEGYKRYGLNSFLVKQIRADEPVHVITRSIKLPCRT